MTINVKKPKNVFIFEAELFRLEAHSLKFSDVFWKDFHLCLPAATTHPIADKTF